MFLIRRKIVQKRMKNKKKGGTGMYFESKDKGGIDALKNVTNVKITKEEAAKRLQLYMAKFDKARSDKTKGGNN